jgi:molybdenum-dependent DNA-binding transcriptional regulator ModE
MSKLIVNCETGEEIVRELNKAEKDQQKLDEINTVKIKAKLEAEANAKEAARQAILDRLGLTADEAKLILG